MFQQIYIIYLDIKNKEVRNAVIFLKIMINILEAKKEMKTILESRGKPKYNPPLQEMKSISSDLSIIKTRSNRLWDCDEIRFYPNVNWHKFFCTYKFFPI